MFSALIICLYKVSWGLEISEWNILAKSLKFRKPRVSLKVCLRPSLTSCEGPCVIWGAQLGPWVWKDTSPRLISSMDSQLHQHWRLSTAPSETWLLHQEAAQQLCRGCHTPCYSYPNTELCKKTMLTVIHATCTHEGYCSTPQSWGCLLGILGWKTVLCFTKSKNHGVKLRWAQVLVLPFTIALLGKFSKFSETQFYTL